MQPEERARVLISAYACEPDRGSEPEVGLQAMLVAAERFDVVVLTRSNNIGALEAHLEGHPLGERIRLVGIDVGGWPHRMKKRLGRLGFYWYYDRWQRLAGSTAELLHREEPFQLVHHVTLATYWQRVGVHGLGIPYVLGPVGGGVSTPRSLLPELGLAGIVSDILRLVTQRFWELRPAVRASLRVADVVLAQNPETSRRIRTDGELVVAPNGVSAALREPVAGVSPRSEFVVVGRMIPFKGGALALRAFAGAEVPGVRLVFIGDGPERGRLEALAASLGVEARVEFAGRLPREEVLRRVGGAVALLHPAVHDDSPLTVAEALSLGTPVVCLDRGGPPVICSLWPDVRSHVVPVTSRAATIAALSSALESAGEEPVPRVGAPLPPSKSFGAQLVEAYDSALSDESGRSV